MKRYQRYLYLSSVRAFLTVVIGIALLEFLLTFISEITYGGQDGYGFKEAFIYLAMTQFDRLYALSGVVFLVAFLVALGGLANRSELTVLQAVGVTKAQLVAHGAVPFVGLALVFFAISEYASPQWVAQAERLKMQWTGESSAGGWYREGDHFIYAASFDDQALADITLLTLTENGVSRHVQAQRAKFSPSGWLLFDGSMRQLQDQQVRTQVFDQWQSPITASQETLNGVMRDPNSLPLRDLWHYQARLAEQGIASQRLTLNFWQRISQPLLALALLIVAAGVVFGSNRHVPVSRRVIVGVIIGLALRLSQDLLFALTLAYQLNAAVMSLLPVVLLTIGGIWTLSRRV